MRYLRILYVQVLLAIVAGVLLGHFHPGLGADLKPLGDGFIKLIKMLVAPIIFATVVSGIGGMGNLRAVGRVGAKALVYFEVVTTVALAIGLVVANVFQPGSGVNASVAGLASDGVAGYAKSAESLTTVGFLLNIIPSTFVGAFTGGDLLQVLCVSLLFGFSLAALGDKGRPVTDLLHHVARVFLMMVNLVAKLAPLAAFGAMAFTVGKYGLGSLKSLAGLMACVYLTCGLFVAVVLGLICRLTGFSLWRTLGFLKEELLIVLGTCSSEAALPGLMSKLERAGCQKGVVGIVIPSGYSFNLDGTCIYLTMGALFIAQALNVPFDLSQQLGLLVVLLITSKGAAGITGSGFVTLAATLSATGGAIPVAGMALILGVDRFLAEARAVTNFIGNAVATLVVARWEGAFDRTAPDAPRVLAGPR